MGSCLKKQHDLSYLHGLLAPVCTEWSCQIEDLRFLTRAAVDFRYPGESADKEEAAEAFEICTRLREKLVALLEGTPSCRPQARIRMQLEPNLTMQYDSAGDILYIGKTPPYPEQESEELDHGIVARLNPKSGEIENLEVLFFSKRTASGEVLKLPIFAEFRLARRV